MGMSPNSLTPRRLCYAQPWNQVATLDSIVGVVQTEVPAAGLPQVGWQAGDGNAPRYWLGAPNAADVLSLTGSPTVGKTPWLDVDGAAIPSEVHTGSSQRSETGVAVTPAVGEDLVVHVVTSHYSDAVYRCLVSNYNNSGQGWLLMVYNGNVYLKVAGTTTVTALSASASTGHALLSIWALAAAGGNMVVLANCAPGTPLVSPGGLWGGGPGYGFAVGSVTGGGIRMAAGQSIVRSLVWHGTAVVASLIADSYAEVKRLDRLSLGYERQTGRSASIFARSSAATVETDGHLHLLGSGAPRAGCLEGYYQEDFATENKCYNNVNPTVTTGLAASGGTLTAESDATAIDAANLHIGPNAFKLVPGAGAEHVACGETTGNTNKHSLSVRVRVSAGSTAVELGWDEAGVWTKVADITATAAYVRHTAEDLTPPTSGAKLAVRFNAGATGHFILMQNEEAAASSSEVINAATAATATRVADAMTLPADSNVTLANGWNLRSEGKR